MLCSMCPSEPFFLEIGECTPAPPSVLAETIIATSERQSSFLWQVSGPSYREGAFLVAAIERYDKFLRLMGTCGLDKHFYVPSYDIDLCWHTHMLVSCSAYHDETRLRAGSVVDHDDSVNERHEGSKLNVSWASTKNLWRQVFGDAGKPLDAAGACYRGEPPAWWFESRHAPVTVHDDFITEGECKRLLMQLPDESALACDMEIKQHVSVPCLLHRRILNMISGASSNTCSAHGEEAGNAEQSAVQVPAKMSKRGVALHKDQFCNKKSVDGFVAVVYLTSGGTMTLIRQEGGRVEREVDITAGRMIVWDNRLLMHKVDAGSGDQVRVMLGTANIHCS